MAKGFYVNWYDYGVLGIWWALHAADHKRLVESRDEEGIRKLCADANNGLFDDYRVASREDEGGPWWGVYSRDGSLLAECRSEDYARTLCQRWNDGGLDPISRDRPWISSEAYTNETKRV
jgi:hypothetical protein